MSCIENEVYQNLILDKYTADTNINSSRTVACVYMIFRQSKQ